MLAGLAPAVSAGPIYRCASAGGIAYQELPCPAASAERAWHAPEFPPVNLRERDRLLQREAALDARLLRRAEIEAAERIAREERRERELELAAERERARQAQPVYVVPWLLPGPRHWRPRLR